MEMFEFLFFFVPIEHHKIINRLESLSKVYRFKK